MLASIQQIREILPHSNADSLELAQVLGWQVVVKKGEFKPGDLVVYIQIDSVLPEASWCEFMRERAWRVRSVKFRGEISQGMVFPLSILPMHPGINCHWVTTDEGNRPLDGNLLGESVTETLQVKKFERGMPKNADARGNFPLHIICITDEERIQNMPSLVDEMLANKTLVDVRKKHDGTSFTYVRNGLFNGEISEIVCSRRQALKETSPEESFYWHIVHKYNLRNIPDDIVIQGEICGPKIQGNKEKLKEYRLYVFNAFSQKTGYYTPEQLDKFCEEFALTTAQKVYSGEFCWDMPNLLDFASEMRYDCGSLAEGVVIRSQQNETYKGKPLSFKVISNKFLLKHGD